MSGGYLYCVRYEAIKLPKFSGDPLEYPEFMNAFTTHVINDKSLPDSGKFEMLRQHLEGQALQVVKGVSLSSTCFQEALNELHRAFARPVQRTYTLIRRLNQLTPKSSAPDDVSTFLREIYNLLKPLWAPGPPELSIAVRMMVTNKVPNTYHKRFMELESIRDSILSIPDLFDALHFSADQIKLESWTTQQPDEEACTSQQAHVYTSHSRQHNRSSTIRPPSHGCIFCGGRHGSSLCDVHVSPSAKRSVLMTMKPSPCWICLDTSHRSRTCSKGRCSICNQDHAVYLCNSYSPHQVQHQQTSRHLASNVEPSTSLTALSASIFERVLPIARLHITSGNNVTSVETALLDSGSQRSFISSSVAKKLQLRPLREDTLSLQDIGGTNKHIQGSIFEVPVKLMSGETKILQCFGLPTITGHLFIPPLSTPDLLSIKNLYSPTVLPPSGHLTPSLLLGVDVLWDVWGVEQPHLLPSGLHLLRSAFGPVVSGTPRSFHAASFTTITAPSRYEPDHENPTPSRDSPQTLDEWAVKLFEESVTRSQEGRLSVALPFHSPISYLTSNNYHIAHARLKQLCSKYQRTDKWQLYADTILQQLGSGILEAVPREEESSIHSKVSYYIPHSAVFKPSSSTTKLRIVLDASSHAPHSPSLNELLLIGPSELPDVRRLLIKLRLAPIAVIADIEKAFHQVELHPEHRDFTRILWLKNSDLPPSHNNMITLRHTRLPFGVASSPFLLSAALKHHISHSQSPLTSEILESTYVNNVILTRTHEEACLSDLPHLVGLFEQIGMNLREFASNSAQSLETIPPAKRSQVTNLSALGVKWDSQLDILQLQTPSHISVEVRTRRMAMSILAAFYDPLGLIAPPTLTPTHPHELYVASSH